jgi:hypothetical protein
MSTLNELLSTTGDYAQPHPHGGFQVFVLDQSRRHYFDLCDHKVIASLSGPSLHLFPSDKPTALLGAFLSY